MRIIAVVIAALLATTLFSIIPQSTPTSTPTQIQSVTPLHDNGWTITLDNGERLFVEVRALETAGRAPRPGLVDNFVDQHQVLGLHAGYATFTQGGITYYAFRRSRSS